MFAVIMFCYFAQSFGESQLRDDNWMSNYLLLTNTLMPFFLYPSIFLFNCYSNFLRLSPKAIVISLTTFIEIFLFHNILGFPRNLSLKTKKKKKTTFTLFLH